MSNAVVDLALERRARKLREMVVWADNPTNYENQILRAVSKLRKLRDYGHDKAMNFLDQIIVGKVKA